MTYIIRYLVLREETLGQNILEFPLRKDGELKRTSECLTETKAQLWRQRMRDSD